MKRIFALFCICATAFSCQKAELTQNDSIQDKESVYDGLVFKLPPPAPKSTIDMGTGTVSFVVGDKVKILYGETSGEGIVQENEGVQWLATNIPSTEEGPFYGVYPNTINASLASSTLTLEIPRVVSGEWADANVMAAKTTKEDLSFSFQHACAYVAFEVSAADITAGFNKFQLARADGNGKLFGTQRVSFDSEGAISLGVQTENIGSYFSTVQYLTSAGTYFFPVLAGLSLEGGVIVGRFKDSNGLLRSKLTSTSRGHIAALGNVCSKMTNKEIRYYITPDGAGDGSSWANAAPVSSIETIANAATSSASAPQSWLDKYHYFCLKGATGDGAVYNANLSINSTGNINIIGGYAGSGTPGTRDINTYKTYLEQNVTSSPIVLLSGNAGYIQFYGLNFRNANLSSGNGGAVRINIGTDAHFRSCSFANNQTSDSNFGGALFIDNGASVTIGEESVFEDNSASRGGAIYMRGGSTLKITDTRFLGNASKQSGHGGGSLYLYNGQSDISDCSFEDNTAVSYGGAVYALGGTQRFTDCTFTGNSAANGGAFSVQGSTASVGVTVQIQGGEISSNVSNNATANYGGGAIWMSQGNKATVRCSGVNFIGNKVVSSVASRGGAICMVQDKGAALMVNACVFSGNGFEITGSKAVFGTAIACQNGNPSSNYNDAAIYNSTFTGGYATGASKANTCSLMLTGSGLLVNSTVVESTQSGDYAVRYANMAEGRTVLYNSITLNQTASAVSNVPSNGYVLANAAAFTPGATDYVDNSVTQASLGLNFTTNPYGSWSGTTPAGYTKGANATDARAAVRSHAGIGEAFDEWLLSLDENIYSKSGNGATRTTPFWPGAFQN